MLYTGSKSSKVTADHQLPVHLYTCPLPSCPMSSPNYDDSSLSEPPLGFRVIYTHALYPHVPCLGQTTTTHPSPSPRLVHAPPLSPPNTRIAQTHRKRDKWPKMELQVQRLESIVSHRRNKMDKNGTPGTKAGVNCFPSA